MSKELKGTMYKDLNKHIMTTSHQLENITKNINYLKVLNGNSGIEK